MYRFNGIKLHSRDRILSQKSAQARRLKIMIIQTRKTKESLRSSEELSRSRYDDDDDDENAYTTPSKSCINIKQRLKDFAWETYDGYNYSDS